MVAHPAGILPVLGTNNLSRIATISDALKVRLDRQIGLNFTRQLWTGSCIDVRWRLTGDGIRAT